MGEDYVVARGHRYKREVVVPSPAPPHPVDDQTRWRRTEVSPGRMGCLLFSMPLLVAPWRFVATGSTFWFLVLISSIGPGWLWLGDTWRRT